MFYMLKSLFPSATKNIIYSKKYMLQAIYVGF